MLRIGILGAARIAPRAIIEPARRRSDVDVVAVASRRAGAAAPYASQHGIARAMDGYEALIGDPGIDLVFNALPPVDHARWSILALEAGKDVLCEKPFAMNAREAEVMVDTARRTGRRLIEAFHYRLHPAFRHLMALKSSGALGAIISVEARFDAAIPFGESELRHLPDQGGGALMDLGCYCVHGLRSLMESEPVAVSANGTRTRLGVDESLSAELDFSGVPARLETNMAEGTPFLARLNVESERGRLEFDNFVLPHQGHSVREWLDGGFVEHTLAGGTTYDFQLASVVDALKSGAPHVNEGTDSVANMAAIDAIYQKAGFGPR
ncbi:MAG: Gfo/Idh/MocA family oxidoreductase [Alphaproteobacteria bacterium]|nr:Gfo/Idh/MocA family oxidoreductase [Alphaproteobacteria bacterium]